MSGHSKWSTIKRKKGVLDQKRGKLFSSMGREITISARLFGSDVDTNARLRQAIKMMFKKYGWKVGLAIFMYYLIRDVTLYIILPYLIMKGFFS